MNLYELSRSEKADWDEYRGAIVAAETADDARTIHPCGYESESHTKGDCGGWVMPDRVIVRLIGVAEPWIERGVILSDFNAG